jgi:hypothetical protein
LVYERLVLPVVAMTQFLRTPIQPGKVYPTLYITKEEFDSIAMPANCRRAALS